MSSEPSPSGTSGNTPVYLIVSAQAPTSITADNNKDVISVQSLQQPQSQQQQQSQNQSQTQQQSNMPQGRTSTLTNLDLNSAGCNVSGMTNSMPQPSHPQVTFLNQANSVKGSPKVIPAHITDNVTVFPTLSQQQVQNLQKGPQTLTPQQQVVSLSGQNPSISQPISSVAQSSGRQYTEPVSMTNDTVGAQLIGVLTALQQRQQQLQRQQQQPELLSTAQHVQQSAQQHLVFQNSDLSESGQASTAHLNNLIQTASTQGLQIPTSPQQLFQPSQDMSQVLQAVLSHTAAMQGNLTTILTTLSNLMQQQQLQQSQHQQQQEQLKQESPVMFGHQLQMGAQTLLKPANQNVSLDKILPHASSMTSQSADSSDCPMFAHPVFKQTPSVTSCSVTPTSSCIFSDSMQSTKIQPIETQSSLASNPMPQASDSEGNSKLKHCDSSGGLHALPHNFDGVMSSTSGDQQLSATPPISLPMDVDALLQQILGDTYSQKSDPILASAKMDVSESQPTNSEPIHLNNPNQQFVDSLLNQAETTQSKVKANTAPERQNNVSGSSSGTSTLRSLLTESSWLNVVNKTSENPATQSSSLSSNPIIFGDNCPSAVHPSTFMAPDSKDNIAELQQQSAHLEIQKEQGESQCQEGPQHMEKQLQIQHEMRDSATDGFEQIDNSSQLPQHQVTQHQMININLDIDIPNSQRSDSHMPPSLVSNLNQPDQPSQPNLEMFASRPDVNMDYNPALTLPLNNARHGADGESSGAEDSSPSYSPSSSHCGSPIPSRNSPSDFVTSEMVCQDSDTQMSVIRRYHDMHIGSCSDSVVDEIGNSGPSATTTVSSSAAGQPSLTTATGMPNMQMLNTQFSSVRSSVVGVTNHVRSSAQSTVGDESQTGLEDEDDDDEMEPAAKQRRGINQTHVSDFCTTDDESNHGNFAASTWSSPSAPTVASGDASSPPPLVVNQTPRLSGSGASLIMPASLPASGNSDPPPKSTPTNQHRKIPRLPSLSNSFEPRQGAYDLKILVQPEEQHRARYMTEGSRGAVKDRTGQGHPLVQLFGWRQVATLQVFVGTDVGRVKPHGFYQACKVSGKNSTPCKERNFDGTNVIEIQFDPQKDMKLSIDCVGILKLRNADVEQRVGLHKTKKSTKARLVFRVNLPRGDGSFITIQTFTDPILCTQPIGSPEISRISATEGSCLGGLDLFIIGKNFARGTKVVFQEVSNDGKEFPVWEKESEVETEHLGQSHLICKVPPYCSSTILSPVSVQIVIHCNGRSSEPHMFTYKPDMLGEQRAWNILSVATSLSRTSSQDGRSPGQPSTPGTELGSNFVSPVAVELNKLVQVKPSPNAGAVSSGDYLPAQAGSSLPFHLTGVDVKSNSSSGSPAVTKDSPPVCGTELPTDSVGNGGDLGEVIVSGGSPSHQVRSSGRTLVTDGPEQMDWAKFELPLGQSAEDCYFFTELSGSAVSRVPANSGQTHKGSLQTSATNPDSYYIP